MKKLALLVLVSALSCAMLSLSAAEQPEGRPGRGERAHQGAGTRGQQGGKQKGQRGKGMNMERRADVVELKYFPEAPDGMDRFVIWLPQRGETDAVEYDFKVEIIPGKMMEVDCNHHNLMGSFTEQTVDGFGYTYYVFNSNGNVASTRMGCPDNTLTEKFVTGATELVRYNSKLPLVVMVPKGFEVKFKVWRAGQLQDAVNE